MVDLRPCRNQKIKRFSKFLDLLPHYYYYSPTFLPKVAKADYQYQKCSERRELSETLRLTVDTSASGRREIAL